MIIGSITFVNQRFKHDAAVHYEVATRSSKFARCVAPSELAPIVHVLLSWYVMDCF